MAGRLDGDLSQVLTSYQERLARERERAHRRDHPDHYEACGRCRRCLLGLWALGVLKEEGVLVVLLGKGFYVAR